MILKLQGTKFAIPVLIWLVLGLVLCLVNFAPATHQLVDPDDYMRAVRVFQFLSGQDNGQLQPRLGPDGGTLIMWSRLVDWPIAALITLFKPLTHDTREALYWAATILPLAQLLVLTLLICWAVSPVMGKKRAPFAAFLLILLLKIVHEFEAGRIDHHGWQILFMLAGYGCLTRVWFRPLQRRWPLLAGLCFATGLAIGADIVLWLGLAAMWGGLFWLLGGRDYERPNLLFGLGLAAATAGYFLFLIPAKDFLAPACDGFSVVYLTLAAMVPLFWGAAFVVPGAVKETFRGRLATGVVLGVVLFAALVLLYPSCFTDPYYLHSPKLQQIWLSRIVEAENLIEFTRYMPLVSQIFLLPLAGGLAAAIWACRKDTKNAVFWLGFLVIYVTGLVVSALQLRLITFMQVLALWPLGWTVAYGLEKLEQPGRNRNDVKTLLLSWFGVIALLVWVNFSYSAGKVNRNKNLAHCPVQQLAERLDRLPGTQLLLPHDLFSGSELLFRTQDRVLTAPYHRDREGMLAMFGIFSDADSEKLARKTGIDFILVCKGRWPFPSQFADRKKEDTLFYRLSEEMPPDWLKRRRDLEVGNFRVYQLTPALP